MTIRSRWGVCLWGIIALTTVSGAPAERLRIVGSDLLGTGFTKALEQDATGNGYSVEQAFEGSRVGLEAVKAGTADAALVWLAPDEKVPEGNLVSELVAYRVAVVAVPAHIDVTEVTFEQLDGFFGADGGAGYSLWKDLGAGGSAAPLSVSTHVWADASAGFSTDFFSHLVLRTQRLKTSVIRHEKLEQLLSRVRLEEGGLAILPQLPPRSAGLRVLAVAKKKGDPAFGPSAENIHTGDYPLRWPLLLVYRSEDQERVRRWRTFLFSDGARKMMSEAAALTPVPTNARPTLE